jgi:3-deoxy-D-manno-octulosonic-acid transferase
MLTIYKAVVNSAYALAWPYLLWKRFKGDPIWKERAAYAPESYLPAPGDGCIWFHASSVGETRVLERLAEAVRSLRPTQHFVVSTFTTSGRELVSALLPDARARFLFPLDAYFPLHRLFNVFRPRGVVIVETEIWPYFLSFCDRLDVPVILANGRLSTKSAARYGQFRFGLRRAFRPYRSFLMQSEADAERIHRIGAPSEKIRVTGNIKHDSARREDADYWRKAVRDSLGLQDGQALFIAASTRPGEEEKVLKALRKTGCFPHKIRLLLAPRHLDRLDEVRALLSRENIGFVDYSTISDPASAAEPVVLMDRLGLLSDLLYGADLCFVGGTLADLGGHNIMEPVTCGVPVVYGPSVGNVEDASRQIIADNHGSMIADENELAQLLAAFLAGEKTFTRFEQVQTSVAEKTAEIILKEFGA